MSTIVASAASGDASCCYPEGLWLLVGGGGDEAEDRAVLVGHHRHPAVGAVTGGADDAAAVAGGQVHRLVGVGGAEVDRPAGRVRLARVLGECADAADYLLAVDQQ